MSITNSLKNVTKLTSNNADKDIFDKFRRAVSLLKENNMYDDIIGLWYVNERTCDGGIQTIIHTTLEDGTLERLKISGLLGEILNCEIEYDYDKDVVHGSGMIKTDKDDLEYWILSGKVYCVFDKERD